MPDAEADESGGSKKQWQGFSDYEDVAAQLHKDINRAVDAYAHLDSRDTQGISLTPDTAIKARSAILKITKRLSQEVERQNHMSPFDEMSKRWHGDGEDEVGYVKKLENANFYEDGLPPWLSDLVNAIVTAGWELGYLKAGRQRSTPDGDNTKEVKEMFK